MLEDRPQAAIPSACVAESDAAARSQKEPWKNTSAEDQETIHEFLVESHENLSRLYQDLVELEKHPHDVKAQG
jgi:hypothetical protein